MDTIRIIKRPRLKKPYLIAAWPGMGEVAFKASAYMIEKLSAEPFAEILPEEFFYLTGSVIKDGIIDVPSLPQSTFYYWKNPATRKASADAHDLIFFLSNAQPDLSSAEEYTRKILQLAKHYRVEQVICLASLPQPIDHMQNPGVWLAATSEKVRESFKHPHLNVLTDGQISGMNGLFLGLAKQEGFSGFCLLGEIPLYTIQIENPKAALALVRVLSALFSLPVNLDDLIEHAQTIEVEINKLMEYFKVSQSGAQNPPIGEDEIEKMKKALSQLTKLPASIKAKIERLFDEARSDLSKANDLKRELDTWNVYKDYEDRFLDLFRDKGKGTHLS